MEPKTRQLDKEIPFWHHHFLVPWPFVPFRGYSWIGGSLTICCHDTSFASRAAVLCSHVQHYQQEAGLVDSRGKACGDKICFRFQQVFIQCSCNKHISNSRRENYKDVHLLSRAVLQLRLMTFVKSKKTKQMGLKGLRLKKRKMTQWVRSDVLVLHMLKLNMWKPRNFITNPCSVTNARVRIQSITPIAVCKIDI